MNIPLLMRLMTRYFILNTHAIICALVISLREQMLFTSLLIIPPLPEGLAFCQCGLIY